MRASAAALAAVLLAGCGARDGSGNGAAEGKARAPAAGNSARADAAPQQAGPAGLAARSIQAGQWEMTARVIQIEMPGAPPDVQAQIAAQRNRQQVSRTCITPAQAADPLREFRSMMVRGQQGANCQSADDVFAGGVIRIRAACRAAGGGPGSAQMAMEGSFTATTLQATLSINAVAPSPSGPNASARSGSRSVRMSSTVSGRRIGECPRGSAQGPAR